mgnify:CR=1 FL=1
MDKRVLIVDDSASMRQMIRFTLTEEGCEVYEAENGRKGLEVLDTAAPDLIITDINMPELDGIGFIQEIRKTGGYKFTPIIVLTTESEKEKQEEGKKAGATAWLVKPFTPDGLMETVRKVAG